MRLGLGLGLTCDKHGLDVVHNVAEDDSELDVCARRRGQLLDLDHLNNRLINFARTAVPHCPSSIESSALILAIVVRTRHGISWGATLTSRPLARHDFREMPLCIL